MLQKLDFNFSECGLIQDGSVTMKRENGAFIMMTVPEHEFWKNINNGEDKEPSCVFSVKEVEPGIYLSGLNLEHQIPQYTNFNVVGSYERFGKDGFPRRYEQGSSMTDYFENTVESYGVADNVEQVKERYKEQIASNAPIVISITEINKKDQPEEGGWRWHKWGEYIGTKEPQCEYIYDEPEIESVYVFQVYSVKPKVELNLNEISTKKNKI